jgi:hypothetical protein
MSKRIPQWWEVEIWSHDEWGGPELEDRVAFAMEDHIRAIDYVRLLRYNCGWMSSDFYWVVNEPVLKLAGGLFIADACEIYYNGPDYYLHLQRFEADKVDFRLPSNEL